MTDATWTGKWVLPIIEEHSYVSDATLISAQIIKVVRKSLPTVTVATVAEERLDADALASIIDQDSDICFVVNVPKETCSSAEAFRLAASRNIPFGGVGDLMRALRLPNPRMYEAPDFKHIERVLQQYKGVSSFQRLNDRKYRICRPGKSDIAACFLHDYELTADALRAAYERYGPFTDAVCANPNGKSTASAKNAAAAMGCAIHDEWTDFTARIRGE